MGISDSCREFLLLWVLDISSVFEAQVVQIGGHKVYWNNKRCMQAGLNQAFYDNGNLKKNNNNKLVHPHLLNVCFSLAILFCFFFLSFDFFFFFKERLIRLGANKVTKKKLDQSKTKQFYY